jgi:hypothetical protein
VSSIPPRTKPGDRVYLQNMPVMALEVIDTSAPALITLRAPSGATLRAGRRTVIRVETQEANT